MAASSQPFASLDTKQSTGRHGSSNVNRSGRGAGVLGMSGEGSKPLVNCNVDVRTGLCVLLTDVHWTK